MALRPLVGLMTPRQFGPTMRMPPRRASANTRASSSAPAGPVSRKPAEMISAAGTPASTHCRMISGTVAAGVTTTARSTGPGTSPTAGYDLRPSTVSRRGLTGWTAPPNEVATRFARTVRPTLPGVSVAPMTATDRGLKNGSSGCLARLNTS